MLIEKTNIEGKFPEQKIGWRRKTQKWAAQCVAYGADRDAFHYSPVRNSVLHKKINYDLLNGKLHMDDLVSVVNPNGLQANYIPDKIQHYPIMNSRLDVLKGEELSRPFEYKIIVTNPNAISEIERKKQEALVARIEEGLRSSSRSQEEFEAKVQQELDDLTYNYQDANELVANQLMEHYNKENNYKLMFNEGFSDGYSVGEEIYQIYIKGGEPAIRKLDPCSITAYQMGRSSKFEDADMIVITDWLSPGMIIDLYGDKMTSKEIDYVVNYVGSAEYDDFMRTDGLGGTQETATVIDQEALENGDLDPFKETPALTANDLYIPDFTDFSKYPYDVYGNIKVCQVFWKTYRKIQKIKGFDPITGEQVESLQTEDYIPNKEMGETSTTLWILEAWKGVKIGDRLYVDMGPCPIQYNTLDDPNRCYFGIVGSVYNFGNDRPFPLVDIMKPYAYLYDVTFDRLNRLLARNYGKVIRLDLAKVPAKFGMEEVMRMITAAGIFVENSFEEVHTGPNTGKLAGGINNANSGTIDLELSQSIAQYINVLGFIEQAMGKVAGITDQRQGQIANRETVGGVERSVLQSSHITEWWFAVHNDVKRRALNCLADLSRACLKGTTKKFQYITSYNLAQSIVTVDGDAYAMNSYGLVVDDNYGSLEFNKNLPMIIQAALQNQSLDFSSILQLFNAASRGEKQKIVERGEQNMQQRQQQVQQQQLESQQQIAQMERETALQKMEHERAMNTENNETKILVATIQAESKTNQPIDTGMSEGEQANLDEKRREFDANNKLAQERLAFDKQKAQKDAELKLKQINKPTKTAK